MGTDLQIYRQQEWPVVYGVVVGSIAKLTGTSENCFNFASFELVYSVGLVSLLIFFYLNFQNFHLTIGRMNVLHTYTLTVQFYVQ